MSIAKLGTLAAFLLAAGTAWRLGEAGWLDGAWPRLLTATEATLSVARAAYARAPAASIGIAALAAVPIIACSVLFGRGIARLAAALQAPGDAVTVRHAPLAGSIAARAWVELAGKSRDPVPIRGELLRIGRDEDNDLVLPGRDLMGFHAVIARNGTAGFLVVDTSGGGITVNGRQLASAHLSDGDRIALGGTALVFRHGRLPHAEPAPASSLTH